MQRLALGKYYYSDDDGAIGTYGPKLPTPILSFNDILLSNGKS